jgi:hypothetical protein
VNLNQLDNDLKIEVREQPWLHVQQAMFSSQERHLVLAACVLKSTLESVWDCTVIKWYHSISRNWRHIRTLEVKLKPWH